MNLDSHDEFWKCFEEQRWSILRLFYCLETIKPRKWRLVQTNISQLDYHHGKWVGVLYSPHINMLLGIFLEFQDEVLYFYHAKGKCSLFYFYICISRMFLGGQLWHLISSEECGLKEIPLPHILNGLEWSIVSIGFFPEGDLIIFWVTWCAWVGFW